MQAAHIEQAEVGRNTVARLEEDNVAGEEFLRMDVLPAVVAPHGAIGVNPLAKRSGDSGGREKDVNQRLVDLSEELKPCGRAASQGDAVQAKFLLPAPHLIRGQTRGQVDAGTLDNRFSGEFVPCSGFQCLHVAQRRLRARCVRAIC